MVFSRARKKKGKKEMVAKKKIGSQVQVANLFARRSNSDGEAFLAQSKLHVLPDQRLVLRMDHPRRM